jgi:hypothetical protein
VACPARLPACLQVEMRGGVADCSGGLDPQLSKALKQGLEASHPAMIAASGGNHNSTMQESINNLMTPQPG